MGNNESKQSAPSVEGRQGGGRGRQERRKPQSVEDALGIGDLPARCSVCKKEMRVRDATDHVCSKEDLQVQKEKRESAIALQAFKKEEKEKGKEEERSQKEKEERLKKEEKERLQKGEEERLKKEEEERLKKEEEARSKKEQERSEKEEEERLKKEEEERLKKEE
eukprot:CAMPEP_0201520626 /NCGR_PEP_ID=MMETSP0161_2-20130828/12001_1 /ASSEMBLY_ACC=CAM_ASM_000251 /TAXON_ID=180227 /ORGANISM="Neoparamoeba aestuarina, Strain SoJaBio B1-5/56/2" /LENGTH=164 /DNA_ID=CAMNT_0047919069 /DNA_START=127 /DNA_END=618 /DNA_ORIENTATION=-